MRFIPRLMLSREGWYYLIVMAFIAAGATRQQINLLVILFGMLAGPLIINMWYAGSMLSGIRIRRKLPTHAVVGETVVIEIEAESQRKVSPSWAIIVEDHVKHLGANVVAHLPSKTLSSIPFSNTTLRPKVIFSHLPPGESRKTSYRGTLNQRGKYQLKSVSISTSYPFGLVNYWNHQKLEDTLIVYPQLGRLTTRWQQLRQQNLLENNESRMRQVTHAADEFRALRPWSSGDSQRWIHWRTSAKQNQLMVRQFEQPTSRNLVLIVDLMIPDEPTLADWEAVELAVSCAATICQERCLEGGAHLTVGILGNETYWEASAASHGFLEQLMYQFAIAEPATPSMHAASSSLEIVSPTSSSVKGSTNKSPISSRKQSEVVCISTRPRTSGETNPLVDEFLTSKPSHQTTATTPASTTPSSTTSPTPFHFAGYVPSMVLNVKEGDLQPYFQMRS